MDTMLWAFAGIVMGGILHIVSIFGIPALAQKDGWSRLSSALPTNTLTVSSSVQNALLPFTPPDVIHAYCPFDISTQNLIITSPLPETTWSVAVSTQNGENFYLVTGADAKATEVRILVIPRSRLAQEVSTEKSDDGAEQNIIVSNATKGIAAIRAPLRGESFRAQTIEWIEKARCELQRPVDVTAVSTAKAPDVATPPAYTASPPLRSRRYRRRRR